MAITRLYDATTLFNANSKVNIDIGEWDNIIVQVVTPSSALTFNTTNDAGGVTGVSDGNASTATNFIAVLGTNLNTGTTATSTTVSSIYKFPVIGKFFQIIGTSATVTKLLINYQKIE